MRKPRYQLYANLGQGQQIGGWIPTDDSGNLLKEYTIICLDETDQTRVSADPGPIVAFPRATYDARMTEIPAEQRNFMYGLLKSYGLDVSWIIGDTTFGEVISYVAKTLFDGFDTSEFPLVV